MEARCLLFSFAARSNLRRRVQRRQLNSSELNVTPMSGDTVATSSRSSSAESGQQGTQTDSTETPLHLRWGTKRWFTVKKEYVPRSESGMYNHCFYPPGHPSLIILGVKSQSNHYRLQQFLQLHAMPKSLEYNTTDGATVVPINDTRIQCTTSLPPIKERLPLDAQRMVKNPRENKISKPLKSWSCTN